MPQLCYKGSDGQWHPLGLLLKGKDGLTTSVNGVEQADGNITLTAADIPVSAADDTDVQTALTQRDRVWNLLDNSDFRHPVNQRGASIYTANGYTIDRWQIFNGALGIGDGYIAVKEAYQILDVDVSKTYTLAARTGDGIVAVSGVFAQGSEAALGNLKIKMVTVSGKAEVILTNNDGYDVGGVIWAALYEGEYTADTLPAYVPKGYTAELLECQRYYYKVPGYATVSYPGYCSSATNVRMTIQCPVPMRVTPSISAAAVSTMEIYTAGSARPAGAVAVSRRDGNAVTLDITSSELTVGAPCTVRFNTTVALNADL